MTSTPNIAIIGAGIGGLAASACLRKAGIETTIYEQAQAFARIGAGIQMSPNAMRVLNAIGVGEKVRTHAFEPPHFRSRDFDTGDLTNAANQFWAVIISFLAPVSHTLGAIYARRQPHIAPPAMATGQMVFGAAILTPLAFIAEEPLSLTPSMGAIGAMLVTGIACTAVAMSLYFIVVRRVGATRSSLMPLFMPVVAVLLGAAVLGERLPVEAFLGLALILAGALTVSGGAPPKPSLAASPGPGSGESQTIQRPTNAVQNYVSK